ncbi:MAG: hypothetical protein AAGA54_36470 [Myxococcota bacterium]
MRRTIGLAALSVVFCNTVGCTDRAILDDGIRGDDDVPEPPEDDGPEPPEDDGTEPPEDDDVPEPPEDDGPEPPDDDDVPEPPIDCIDVTLSQDLPLVYSASIESAESRYQPSCVGAVSAEATHAFTAPFDGTFVFRTAGSNFDTVLYALGPACGQPELACNDDVDGTTFSEIAVPMSGGETITVVVDGFNEVGSYQLEVAPAGGCPDEVLPPDPEVILADFLDGDDGNSVSPSCGNGGVGPDVVYSWTAPFSGSYLITTQGSAFDTILSVYTDGCATEIACDDDGAGFTSALTLDVAEGEELFIAIDAFEGPGGEYQLLIFPN